MIGLIERKIVLSACTRLVPSLQFSSCSVYVDCHPCSITVKLHFFSMRHLVFGINSVFNISRHKNHFRIHFVLLMSTLGLRS